VCVGARACGRDCVCVGTCECVWACVRVGASVRVRACMWACLCAGGRACGRACLRVGASVRMRAYVWARQCACVRACGRARPGILFLAAARVPRPPCAATIVRRCNTTRGAESALSRVAARARRAGAPRQNAVPELRGALGAHIGMEREELNELACCRIGRWCLGQTRRKQRLI
jgi:hypothetical protein